MSSECEPLNLICFELDLKNVAGNLSCDLLHGSVFVKPGADHSIIGLQCLCSVLRFASCFTGATGYVCCPAEQV